jgi:hypothetical protein
MIIKEGHKAGLRILFQNYGFDSIIEQLIEEAYAQADLHQSNANREKARHYYHLAVDLEPAVKSAIERGL